MSRRRIPADLRTLAVVPRWSVVQTLTRDTVASHSYFVTFYTREIAILIGWTGDMGDLLFRALVHDTDEVATGDICSPIKQQIIDDKKAAAYIQVQLERRLPYVVQDLEDIYAAQNVGVHDNEWDGGQRIIKCADKLDALIFLITERRLGNGVVAPHVSRGWNKFEATWRALPAGKDELDRLWNTQVVPAIHDHESNGGFEL